MKCFNPVSVRNSESAIANGWPHYIEVPCGKCPACKKSRRSQWAERARRELAEFFYTSYKPFKGDEKDCNLAFLITLTYDNRRIPVSQPVDDCEDVYQTLRYSDVTDFLHVLSKRRLRNGLPPPSTLICGEYGPSTNRPHYHCLIIGISIHDIREMRKNWEINHAPLSFIFERFELTRSRFGTNEYKGVGFKATEIYMKSIQSLMGCAKYVAKYVVKSHKSKYDFPWIVKPRVYVSKSFGLGVRFKALAKKQPQNLEKAKKILELKKSLLSLPCEMEIDGNYNPAYLRVVNSRFLSKDDGGYTHAMPPYLRKLLFPREKVVIYDQFSNKSEKSVYSPFKQGAPICLETPLLDALSFQRFADKRREDLNLIAGLVADGNISEMEAANTLEREEMRNFKHGRDVLLQQYYCEEYELMCRDEF